MLPPDAEIVDGRAAIQEFFARENPPGSAGIEVATIETRVFGDHAYRQGSFRFQDSADGAAAAGKFIELWKKVDGEWLIHRDIWSANAPPPAAPGAAGDESS